MQEFQELNTLESRLGFIKTSTGRKIDLRNPHPDNIDIRDIASGLSKICRFGGQISEFYSVAQHSILVALMAPIDLRGAALLHDASEAYLGDVVKPLKIILGSVYTDLEDAFEEVIHHRFPGLPILSPRDREEIKKYDILALQIEDEAFRMENPYRLRFFYDKYDMLQTDTQLGWPPYLANTLFMKYAGRFL